MSDKHRIEDILNECLEETRAGRRTVEQCLARYPEQACEMEPLLRMALAVRKAASVEARPEFKAAARHRFQETVRAKARKAVVKQRVWWRAWAMAAAAMLAIAVLGSGTVVASAGSTPDQPLYPVKMAKEQVQVFLTRPPLARARLNAALAEERLQEMEQMANRGKLDQVVRLTENLDRHLAAIEEQGNLTDAEAAALRDLIEARALKHFATLKRVEERAPPAARAMLEKARGVSLDRFKRALRNAGVRPEQIEKLESRWRNGLRENWNALPWR